MNPLTDPLTVIRCSSLDRILDCAGSLDEPAAPYKPNNPEANEGRAGHAALAVFAAGTEPDLDQVAADFGVDRDVLEKVVSQARRAFSEVEHWFAKRLPEEYLEADLAPGIVLRGKTDLAGVEYVDGEGSAIERLSFLDWKLGWKPTEHPNQVRGYAFLGRKRWGMPASGYILGVEIWARLGEYRLHKITNEDLDRLREQLLEQVRQRGRQWGPSREACLYCPAQLNCQARAEWLRSGVTAMEPIGGNLPITRELVGKLYDQRRALGAALQRYDQVLEAMLDEGPVPLPGGGELVWEEKQLDQIRPSKAMPILREELRLTAAEADLVLGVTKTGLEKVMKGRSEKGKAAAAMRDAMARLHEAGAVEKRTQRTKTVRDAQEKSNG